MRNVLLGLAALLVVGGAIFYVSWVVPTQRGVAVGAGMLAKQMCSCMFVAERPQADCRADQFAMLDAIDFETIEDGYTVRAFVPVLGERTARYSEKFGCTLQ